LRVFVALARRSLRDALPLPVRSSMPFESIDRFGDCLTHRIVDPYGAFAGASLLLPKKGGASVRRFH
jgi:hypothetical protein